jgi:hypothetical protein
MKGLFYLGFSNNTETIENFHNNPELIKKFSAGFFKFGAESEFEAEPNQTPSTGPWTWKTTLKVQNFTQGWVTIVHKPEVAVQAPKDNSQRIRVAFWQICCNKGKDGKVDEKGCSIF